MNYYILPKKHDFPIIDISFIDVNNLSPYLSHSLWYYLTKANENVSNIYAKNNPETIDLINKSINTYEFIFTNVPNSVLSVSKLNGQPNLFYELFEIYTFCNIPFFFETKHTINTAHFSPHFHSSIYLLNHVRVFNNNNNNNNNNIGCNFEISEINELIYNKYAFFKYDFFFFEFKSDDYINKYSYFKNIIVVLKIIISHQQTYGISIIKIDDIFYKIIVDVIYILSSLFEQVTIIKPQVSNILNSDRFIVCKNFEYSSHLTNIERKINDIIYKLDNQMDYTKIAYSILSNYIPYYFINKLEETNIVLGQQQLETYDKLINIIKNKNKEDKIETLKRNNIQKCILWCEKYKIPHNKFIDKTNIFLNSRIVKDVDIINDS